jgi:small-conductance mechanosensitive channel
VSGNVVATLVVVVAAIVVAVVGSRVAARRAADEFAAHYYRHLARYGAILAGVVALLVVWRDAIGHLAIFAGLFAAGLAFAMQEVIGSIAGWFNIISGGIYRIGDRVEIAGVKGDVIGITLLRTKVLEMGSSLPEEPSWVGGRQSTGRIVSIANKATFDAPTYNYSQFFDYVWEELRIPVPYRVDWKRAEQIMLEEARRVSDTEGAREAMASMTQRFPLPKHEVDPKVYVTLTDNWVELAARFVIPVRQSRAIRDRMARAIRDRFDEAGIEIASETIDLTLFRGDAS